MKSSDNLMVLVDYSKKIIIIDLTSLEILHTFTISGKCESPPFILDNVVYFIPDNNHISKIAFEDHKEIQSLIHLDKDTKHPLVKTINIEHKGISAGCIGFIIIDNKDIIIFKNSIIEMIRSDFSLFNTPLKIEYKSINRLQLTCCGIDISYVFKKIKYRI